MNATILITVGGWFDSLHPVTQAHVKGIVTKGEKKYGWAVKFADQRGKARLPEFDNL